MQFDILNEYILLYDLLNFSETAQQLHISKSALSKHIAALEAEIGVPLFLRGSTLVPTPAGAYFYDTAVMANEQFKLSMKKCNDISEKYPRFFTIGMLSLVKDDAMRAIKKALDLLQRKGVRKFTLIDLAPSPDKLIASLLNDTFDFVVYPTMDSLSDLQTQHAAPPLGCVLLAEDPLVVLMDAHSPLACRDELTVADLRNAEIAVRLGQHNQTKPHVILKMFESYKMTPNIRLLSSDAPGGMAGECEAPDVVQIVPKSAVELDPACSTMTYKEFAGRPYAQKTYGLYKEANTYHLLGLFLAGLKEAADDDGAATGATGTKDRAQVDGLDRRAVDPTG